MGVHVRVLGLLGLVVLPLIAPATGAGLEQCAVSAIDTSRPTGTSGITFDSRGFPAFIALDWFDGEPDPRALYARLPNILRKYRPLWRPGELVTARISLRSRRGSPELAPELSAFVNDLSAALPAAAPVSVLSPDRRAQTVIRIEPHIVAVPGGLIRAYAWLRMQRVTPVCLFPGTNTVQTVGQTDEHTFSAECASTRACADTIAAAVASWLPQRLDGLRDRTRR